MSDPSPFWGRCCMLVKLRILRVCRDAVTGKTLSPSDEVEVAKERAAVFVKGGYAEVIGSEAAPEPEPKPRAPTKRKKAVKRK